MRRHLTERPPVVELRVMGSPPHGRCGACGESLVENEEYLYDNGLLLCEGCLNVAYPEEGEEHA